MDVLHVTVVLMFPFAGRCVFLFGLGLLFLFYTGLQLIFWVPFILCFDLRPETCRFSGGGCVCPLAYTLFHTCIRHKFDLYSLIT